MFKVFRQSKLIQLTFVLSILISLSFIYFSERFQYQQSRLTTKNIANSYVNSIKNNISQALSATYPLAALIRNQDGRTEGFDGLATEMLNFYPSASSLQLQPNGIISHIIPLRGNEDAIGHNVLVDSKGNKEALLARDTGKISLAGPFDLVQGGLGMVARLPIYLETTHGEYFWGFTAVLIDFPEVLESTNLLSLVDAGYAYSLSRIHPDNAQTTIFAESSFPLLNEPELFTIEVPNAQWLFSVSPINSWTPPSQLSLKILFGFLFSLLLSFLSFLLVRLKNDHLVLENTVIERTKALEALAHYDVLTQLPNRTLFSDRFTQAVAHSRRNQTMFAICFLDLDDFKEVNDTHGHDEGDKLLVAVARRLKTHIRGDDTIARQGGDEFILLLNDINSLQQLELTLERIRRAMVKPHLIDGRLHNSNVSIGVTLYPNDNVDLDTLLRHADHAMYQAKVTGKNRYHLFDSVDDELITQKHNDIQEIHKALIKREFQLYYQPKINMKTGHVFGAEALIRWIHPENGVIPPLDFLPLIESTELETQIGGWVINEAIKQLDTWYKDGIELEVSINISSHHLQSPEFFIQLKTALSHYPKVQGHQLQLEILESSELGDIKEIRSLIKKCQHELGINVALDDFGTGYSSLTHLRSLPADTIKIDQTFVRDLLDDPSDFSIIDGIISLAEAFHRDVIAEGVETTEHGLILLIMGCNSAQGYAIARPQPAQELANWLRDYRPNETWLNYGKINYSRQEQKITLIKLTTAYWFKNLSEHLHAGDIALKETFKRCHLGTWLSRLEQDALFDFEWFSSLKQAHEELFNFSEILCFQIEKGLSEQNIIDLNNYYQSVVELLENYHTDPLSSPFRVNIN